MSCGRHVVISGILAWGDPGFPQRENFLHPSRAPCICDFFVFGVASIHARLNCEHISCCNSHRADLSISDVGFLLFSVWCCCRFCFVGFGVFVFLFVFVVFSSCGRHRTWTMFGHALFRDSQRGDDARCCTIRSTDTNTVFDLARAEKATDGKKDLFDLEL